MFLLDTCVVSELRKAHSGKANPNVLEWASLQPPGSMYISVVTLMELETGILRVERKDPEQAVILRRWLERQVLPAFEQRIMNIDSKIALTCARMHVPDPRSDRDALIAATAKVHSMYVVTRNLKDFEPTGAVTVNPWA